MPIVKPITEMVTNVPGEKTTDWGLYWVLLKAQVETPDSVTNH